MPPSVRSIVPHSSLMAYSHFVEPPWDAPLHVEDVLARIPADATIAGMFPLAVVQEAARLGRVLPSARSRYVPFSFYPMHEHVRLMLELCPIAFPRKTLRQALRSLGRAAPAALLGSTLGKVTLGAVDDPVAATLAVTKTYPVNLRPARAEVVANGPKHVVVTISDLYYFADSHHVGVFEGVLRHTHVLGSVRIHVASPHEISYLVSWE